MPACRAAAICCTSRALWTTAAAAVVLVGWAFERWHFAGFSKAQEARKARFTQWRVLDQLAGLLPLSPVRKHLLIKDLKVFLRDVSQWSQLLLLLALVLVYLYNFRVLDLERIPYMSGFLKNIYAFLNLGDGRLRDGDGRRCASCSRRCRRKARRSGSSARRRSRCSDFLWSKFWTGLVPVLVLTEILIVAGNELLGVDPFLKRMSAGGRGLHGVRAGRPGRAASARAIRDSRPTTRARSPDRTAASRS